MEEDSGLGGIHPSVTRGNVIGVGGKVKGIGARVKQAKQTKEFALGVTKVLAEVMKGGKESEYTFGNSGVSVKGYWTEDGIMRLDVIGLEPPARGE